MVVRGLRQRKRVTAWRLWGLAAIAILGASLAVWRFRGGDHKPAQRASLPGEIASVEYPPWQPRLCKVGEALWVFWVEKDPEVQRMAEWIRPAYLAQKNLYARQVAPEPMEKAYHVARFWPGPYELGPLHGKSGVIVTYAWEGGRDVFGFDTALLAREPIVLDLALHQRASRAEDSAPLHLWIPGGHIRGAPEDAGIEGVSPVGLLPLSAGGWMLCTSGDPYVPGEFGRRGQVSALILVRLTDARGHAEYLAHTTFNIAEPVAISDGEGIRAFGFSHGSILSRQVCFEGKDFEDFGRPPPMVQVDAWPLVTTNYTEGGKWEPPAKILTDATIWGIHACRDSDGAIWLVAVTPSDKQDTATPDRPQVWAAVDRTKPLPLTKLAVYRGDTDACVWEGPYDLTDGQHCDYLPRVEVFQGRLYVAYMRCKKQQPHLMVESKEVAELKDALVRTAGEGRSPDASTNARGKSIQPPK